MTASIRSSRTPTTLSQDAPADRHPAKKVLKLDDHFGLHPEMVELQKLFQEGGLAVVPNVGYPNPSRSHFRSTDIWETASPADRMWKTGWIGRYFDAECQGVPGAMLGLRLGEQAALTFAGERTPGGDPGESLAAGGTGDGGAGKGAREAEPGRADRHRRARLRPAHGQRDPRACRGG